MNNPRKINIAIQRQPDYPATTQDITHVAIHLHSRIEAVELHRILPTEKFPGGISSTKSNLFPDSFIFFWVCQFMWFSIFITVKFEMGCSIFVSLTLEMQTLSICLMISISFTLPLYFGNI
ncbi:hypothetical protein O6P43_029456 [Quillaja saponaria]|uniref:Uncharacterized protein n=1 Tax=Quillaja saponaria TaxID=32244 RepID=A0AAD7L016_QUISA|nr:hypothetical protein O6P43_029456 [Quillaja saponaria]